MVICQWLKPLESAAFSSRGQCLKYATRRYNPTPDFPNLDIPSQFCWCNKVVVFNAWGPWTILAALRWLWDLIVRKCTSLWHRRTRIYDAMADTYRAHQINSSKLMPRIWWFACGVNQYCYSGVFVSGARSATTLGNSLYTNRFSWCCRTCPSVKAIQAAKLDPLISHPINNVIEVWVSPKQGHMIYT